VTASPAWFVPAIVTLANPVSDVVGNVPTSPVIVVVPVLVIPAPAKTAKLVAVPSLGCVAASAVAGQIRMNIVARLTAITERRILFTLRWCLQLRNNVHNAEATF
jgi:hypothetical protein